MRIGIITWFRYENYGTKLQAIALQRYLRDAGHDAELIDFLVPEGRSLIRKRQILYRIIGRINFEALKIAQKKYKDQLSLRSRRMEQVISEQCVVTEKAEDDETYMRICQNYDLLICGSDQIWNPNWYHPYYYADFPEIATRKASYAPSLGIRAIPDHLKGPLKNTLSKFSCITVREDAAARLLEPLLGYKPKKALDPTMLLMGERWKAMFDLVPNKNRRYVFCYFLTDNFWHWKAVRRFTSQFGLETVTIPQEGLSYFRKGDKSIDAGVKEFLELILNADYVLTDSFHGAVFSILLEKEVYLFERFKEDLYYSQNDRVKELIAEFGIEDHFIRFNSNTIKPVDPINYKIVSEKLNLLREQSETILIDMISSYITDSYGRNHYAGEN